MQRFGRGAQPRPSSAALLVAGAVVPEGQRLSEDRAEKARRSLPRWSRARSSSPPPASRPRSAQPTASTPVSATSRAAGADGGAMGRPPALRPSTPPPAPSYPPPGHVSPATTPTTPALRVRARATPPQQWPPSPPNHPPPGRAAVSSEADEGDDEQQSRASQASDAPPPPNYPPPSHSRTASIPTGASSQLAAPSFHTPGFVSPRSGAPSSQSTPEQGEDTRSKRPIPRRPRMRAPSAPLQHRPEEGEQSATPKVDTQRELVLQGPGQGHVRMRSAGDMINPAQARNGSGQTSPMSASSPARPRVSAPRPPIASPYSQVSSAATASPTSANNNSDSNSNNNNNHGRRGRNVGCPRRVDAQERERILAQAERRSPSPDGRKSPPERSRSASLSRNDVRSVKTTVSTQRKDRMHIARLREYHRAAKGGNLAKLKEILGDTDTSNSDSDRDSDSDGGRRNRGKMRIGVDDQLMDDARQWPMTALQHAAEHGHLKTVQFLIEQGADPHINNEAILGIACHAGDMAMVQFLVDELGCDPHAGNEHPLRSATHGGSMEVARWLIQEQGADVHANDEHALRTACVAGQLDMVKYLVDEQRVNVHANAEAALSAAASAGRLEVMRFLIEERAANPKTKDKEGNTPLHAACAHAHADVCCYLIEHDLSLLAISNKQGKFPTQVASFAFRERKLSQIIPLYVADGALATAPPPVIEMHVIGFPGAGKTQVCCSVTGTPYPEANASSAQDPLTGRKLQECTIGVSVMQDRIYRPQHAPRHAAPTQSLGRGGAGAGEPSPTSLSTGRESFFGPDDRVSLISPTTTGTGCEGDDACVVKMWDYGGHTEFRANIGAVLPRASTCIVIVVVSLAMPSEADCVAALSYFLTLLRACRGLMGSGGSSAVAVAATHADQWKRDPDERGRRVRALQQTLKRWREQVDGDSGPHGGTQLGGGGVDGADDIASPRSKMFARARAAFATEEEDEETSEEVAIDRVFCIDARRPESDPGLAHLLRVLRDTVKAMRNDTRLHVPKFCETVLTGVEAVRCDPRLLPCLRLPDAIERISTAMANMDSEVPINMIPRFLEHLERCGEVLLLRSMGGGGIGGSGGSRNNAVDASRHRLGEHWDRVGVQEPDDSLGSASEDDTPWLVLNLHKLMNHIVGRLQANPEMLMAQGLISDARQAENLRRELRERQARNELVMSAEEMAQLTGCDRVFGSAAAEQSATLMVQLLEQLHLCVSVESQDCASSGGSGVRSVRVMYFPSFSQQALSDAEEHEQLEWLRLDQNLVRVGRRFTPPRYPQGVVFPPGSVSSIQAATVQALQRHWKDQFAAAGDHMRVRQLRDCLVAERLSAGRCRAKVVVRAHTLDTLQDDAQALESLKSPNYRESIDITVAAEEHDGTAYRLLELLRRDVIVRFVPWISSSPADTEWVVLARSIGLSLERAELSRLHEAGDADFYGCHFADNNADGYTALALQNAEAIQQLLADRAEGSVSQEQMEKRLESVLAPLHERWTKLEKQWHALEEQQESAKLRRVSTRSFKGLEEESIDQESMRQLLVDVRSIVLENQQCLRALAQDELDCPTYPILFPLADDDVNENGKRGGGDGGGAAGMVMAHAECIDSPRRPEPADDGGKKKGSHRRFMSFGRRQSGVTKKPRLSSDVPTATAVAVGFSGRDSARERRRTSRAQRRATTAHAGAITHKFRLRFVCPVSGKLSEGEGYELKQPHEQVQRMSNLLRRTAKYAGIALLGATVVAGTVASMGLLAAPLAAGGFAAAGSLSQFSHDSGQNAAKAVEYAGKFLTDGPRLPGVVAVLHEHGNVAGAGGGVGGARTAAMPVSAIAGSGKTDSLSNSPAMPQAVMGNDYQELLALLRELESIGPTERPRRTGLTRVQGGTGANAMIGWVHTSVVDDVRRLGRAAFPQEVDSQATSVKVGVTPEEAVGKTISTSSPTTYSSQDLVNQGVAHRGPLQSVQEEVNIMYGKRVTGGGGAGAAVEEVPPVPKNRSKALELLGESSTDLNATEVQNPVGKTADKPKKGLWGRGARPGSVQSHTSTDLCGTLRKQGSFPTMREQHRAGASGPATTTSPDAKTASVSAKAASLTNATSSLHQSSGASLAGNRCAAVSIGSKQPTHEEGLEAAIMFPLLCEYWAQQGMSEEQYDGLLLKARHACIMEGALVRRSRMFTLKYPDEEMAFEALHAWLGLAFVGAAKLSVGETESFSDALMSLAEGQAQASAK